MYRPSANEKKSRKLFRKQVNNIVHNTMSKTYKTSKSAREVFNTPPYYLTAKNNKQEKEKEENEHND